MKKEIIILFFLAISFIAFTQEGPFGHPLSYYIENTEIFEENQEEGRTFFIPEKHQSLNGEWKFYWSETPENVPDKFFDVSFNDRKWGTIQVPSNWEMQGYGDKQFRNANGPFKHNPPYVPKEYNPTGIYRRTFNIPSQWKGEQVFLRFEKVASASFVWVNGVKVGYNEGAQEPAEYNITKYIKSGQNSLVVFVVKYSDGYYLEGQDYWRLAGIFDDVWLYAAPGIRIFDWQIITDFDDTFTDSHLKIHSFIKNHESVAPTASYTVKARLFDRDNRMVSEFVSRPFNMNQAGIQEIVLDQEIKNPLKWTSETPYLYTLGLELITAEGKIQDKIQTRMGFNKTEIRGEVFYLNGVPLKVNAQNSHMQHPEKGHTMDEATIRKDFEILKQFNFNAVRTAHYPPVNKYLELANEYGLYIIDEAGTEAHATEWISERPEYAEMYKERVRRMVLRDRNYPCVLFWSAGNESGLGENITETVREGKKYDPTRFWMYGRSSAPHHSVDIIGPRYPLPVEVESQIGLLDGNEEYMSPIDAPSGNPDRRRPSFMDEYFAVAGNGGGGFDEFWDVIYAYPRVMGGAIWDFVSPGITEPVRALIDASPNNTLAHLMGNAKIVKDGNSRTLDLNGQDKWVEIYRHDNLEISGDRLTLTFRVFPRKLSSDCGSYLTKGSFQFGVQQKGRDSLEFYLYTTRRNSVCAPLPADWEYQWHDVAAVYDGEEMSLYIDKNKKASAKVSGAIRNFPFPVNIGRNAEKHGQATTEYICDARMDDVGIFAGVVDINRPDPQKAVLWLDFEEERHHGYFYSNGIGARTYGCIWPDRTPQPEMWQMKKTVQPLSFRITDVQTGTVEVWNRNHFTDAGYYQTRWWIQAGGKILQQGELNLQTAPLSRERITIPYTKPAIEAGCEYYLNISSTLKNDELWAPAGHEVAWDQLELPWFIAPPSEPVHTGAAPVCYETPDMLTVTGADFKYSFDKRKGQLVSIEYKEKEMLRSPLEFNIWRAPLANEQDSWSTRHFRFIDWREGYARSLSTDMYLLGVNRLSRQTLKFEREEKGDEVRIFIREINLLDNIARGGFYNDYEFIITGDGQMTLRHRIKPEGRTMPLWLPRVGITMTLDNTLNQVEWHGRGPQENYPDRKTGYRVGVYHSSVQDMYEPYLLPQDYGLRTDNRRVRMTDKQGTGIQFSVNELFNFNAYPYSTDHLEKAIYTCQLQEQDGITFNLDYVTTGLGCTARGVLDAYRALPQIYERVVTIKPVN